MGCRTCRYYKAREDGYHCIWFDSCISKFYPGWENNFKRGELRFKDCGYSDIE